MNAHARELARLYETLARWQWRRRGREPGNGGGCVELRKRLVAAPGGPADGGASLDEWLRGLAGGAAAPGARVLDLGCGFGASLRRWLDAGAATAVGVTASPFQAGRARESLARAGHAGRATVLVQDFTTPVPGAFDAVLAIEALGHAADLVPVLANVRSALAPGGTFVWVEDALRRAATAGDRDVDELARCWASPPLRPVASLRAAVATAGLTIVREIDLTAHVPVAHGPSLRRRAAALRAACLLPVPTLRRLARAFAGGTALERLYARGDACYVVLLCQRPIEPPIPPPSSP